MDASEFDGFSRALGHATSRRKVAAIAIVSALGMPVVSSNVMARKKKTCPPCKKRKKGKCKAVLPDGSACTGGTCQGGLCRAATSPPPPASPPASCPREQKACVGGCIPVEQCCDNADCQVSGQVCTAGTCHCPAALPEICGGACLAPCAPGHSRRPNCTCCARPGSPWFVTTNECCSTNGELNQPGICAGFDDGASCSFSAQCDSNFCLCGAFGCSCQ